MSKNIQQPIVLLRLIAAFLFSFSATAFSQVSISYQGEESYRAAVVTNNSQQKISVTIQYHGRKMPITSDGQAVSGTTTMDLGPGASSSYGGHGIAITSATVASIRVDRSAEILRKITNIEAQIETLNSDSNVEMTKRRRESGTRLRQQIQNDRELTVSDRQHLISRLDQKIRELDSVINDHDRKKAALLAELQALRTQLQ